MKLTHNCPKCGKPAKIQSEFPLGDLINYVYQCGHLELRKKIQVVNEVKAPEGRAGKEAPQETLPQVMVEDYDVDFEMNKWLNESGIDENSDQYVEYPKYIHHSFKSVNLDKTAYEFQMEGVKFIENSQLNCLIADAMGLGKTVEALLALKRNKEIAFPALIVVKGATLFQWAHETREWVSEEFNTVMPITNRIHIIPGFNIYLLSMDMLSKEDIIEKLLALNLKTVIIDEVQNFKDASAKRTIGLMKLIDLGNIDYKIALSGTPIKNRVTEYGTILHLLSPLYFKNPTLDSKWLLPETKINSQGRRVTKYERLNPLYAEEWKKITSKFIIRRERHDVLKNLPSLSRDYQIVEIDDKNLRNTYNRTLDLFANWLKDNKSGAKSSQLLGWLSQLRAITGQAKCKLAIEWTNDFLESTDEQLAIGIHHHSVRDTLYLVLKNQGIEPLKLSGEDSVYAKADIVRKFTNGSHRLMVINMIAGGIGLNLQTCANALVLEREWNSADEEQFECRFHRNGQQKAVTITYMIAKGTIDEYFHEMVQRKAKILAETGIGKYDLTANLESLLELSEMIVSHKI